jgi:two-component system, cell cycle sensor histidine kinase and response regulator CckA
MKSSITIPSNKKIQIVTAFLGILIIFGVSIYFYYAYESRSLHDAAGQNIQAIADLKIDQITQWRRERIANARTIFQSPFLTDALEAWLIHRENTDLKRKILERLSLVQQQYAFADIFLVSPDAEVLISLDGTSDKLGPKGKKFIENETDDKGLIERDFFISSRDSAIYYDIITSVRNSKNKVIGFLVFRTNPNDYLYPLIRRWSTPSRSSETILVRKDGDSVLYLNDLRFRRNTALRFRNPLSRTDIPAVQAALGVQGIFDGYDYRGVHTLAYLAPVPNSPWRMVAKIDYSEIMAELTYRSIILVVISVIMTLLFVALAVLYYRFHERRMYDAVLEKEEKYQVLFEQAQDGIFIVDAKGRILDVNPSGESMLGYAHHELVGHAMEDLYYGIDQSKILPELDQAHASEPLIQERLMIRKDGTHVPVEFSRTMMPDGNMQKIIRDITDRKRIDEIIRIKEEEYRNLIETMDEGFCIVEFLYDAQGNAIDYRYLEVNQAFVRQTGIHDAVGRTLRELVPHPDEKWFELCANVARTGVSVRKAEPALDNQKYYDVSGYRIGGEGSRKVGIFFMDITDIKRSEQELRESKALLATTEKVGKIGGWSLDTETLIQTWTEETYNILEYDVANEEPKVHQGIEFIAPSSRQMAENAIKRAIEHGESYDQEWEVITGKGNKRWVHSVAHVYREDNKIKRVMGSFQDITDRKEMEQLLRDIQRRESIGVLSSGIAHDFNNLLGVMMGHVSLARTKLQDPHPATSNMEKALTAMENAAELTKQILAYSGKGKFQYVTIDLRAEIEEYISLFSVSKPKNVKLVTDLDGTPVYVNGDPGQIKQVIMNLIINGGDAIGDKQGVVSIKLASIILGIDDANQYAKITGNSLHAGNYAILEVRDDGMGMNQETLGKIFDPFFSTKFAGRGLGLSAVLGIIRSHEGGLIIQSEEGIGTTFQVVLPSIVPPKTLTKPEEEEIQSAPSTTTTILIIDDEAGIADMAREVLESESFSVLVELNPIVGIEIYKQHQNDIGLVLLDLTMPEMSGKEVMELLQEINPDLKIIISSGYTESEVKQKIGKSRPCGFIQKPYPLESLLSMVKKLLLDEKIVKDS